MFTCWGCTCGSCILEGILHACNGNTVEQSAPADRTYSLMKKQRHVDTRFCLTLCLCAWERHDSSVHMRILGCMTAALSA